MPKVMSQVPTRDSSYQVKGPSMQEAFTVNVKARQHREGATFDREGKIIFGPNPLHWTASLATILNIRMLRSSELAEQFLRDTARSADSLLG